MLKKNKKDIVVENEILEYKYETEYFQNKAEVEFEYRIPYEQMNMEYLENKKKEPQYYRIMLVAYHNFVSVFEYLNSMK